MNLRLWKRQGFLAYLIFLTISTLLFSQVEQRFFDNPSSASNNLILTVFHPSSRTISSLLELRKQHLIPSEKLIIVGVYHQQELTSYQKSLEMVQSNNLNWIKFHKLTSPLDKEKIYQKNALTDEFKRIFENSDGLILFGGADIPPYLYQQKTAILTHVQTPHRNFLELSFIFHILGGFQNQDFEAWLESEPQFPILGICLGCQSLNVATGGSLVQDIPFEIYGKFYLEDIIALGSQNWHVNPYARLYPEEKFLPYNLHPIKLKQNSKFISSLGLKEADTPFVVSSHHQMVKSLGKGFKIAATSLDGKVVEAIEHQKYPNVLGLQFHPDFPIIWDQSKKFKITPNQKKEISILSILKDNFPSLSFNKNIWIWFFNKIEAYHNSRNKN